MSNKKFIFLLHLVFYFGIFLEEVNPTTTNDFYVEGQEVKSFKNQSEVDYFSAFESKIAVSPRGFSFGLSDRNKVNASEFFGICNVIKIFQIGHSRLELAYLKISNSITVSIPKFMIAFPHYYFT